MTMPINRQTKHKATTIEAVELGAWRDLVTGGTDGCDRANTCCCSDDNCSTVRAMFIISTLLKHHFSKHHAILT